MGTRLSAQKNICGITYGKQNVYYYGVFASNGIYDFIEGPEGEKICATKVQLGEKTVSVYQIPYNGKKDICYRFVDSENLINEDTLFLNGEVLLYKRENVNESKHESTIGKLKKEQNHLWLLIEQMVKSADKENEIEDGRVYRSEKAEDIIWRIYVNYETGHYLNLERDRKGYDWTGLMKYFPTITRK
jgi:hypothetical protein